jgi:hypothetical protein
MPCNPVTLCRDLRKQANILQYNVTALARRRRRQTGSEKLHSRHSWLVRDAGGKSYWIAYASFLDCTATDLDSLCVELFGGTCLLACNSLDQEILSFFAVLLDFNLSSSNSFRSAIIRLDYTKS